MKRKNLIKLIVGVVLVTVMAVALALGGGCAAPAPGPTPAPAQELPIYTWRFVTAHAPHEAQVLTRPILDDIEAASGGRVKFEVYSAGELMPDDQVLPALQAGTLDFASGNAPCFSLPIDIYPLAGHASGRWESAAEMYTLWHERGLKEIYTESYEELGGIKLIGEFNSDPIHLISTKPVWKYEDLKGMKIIADKSNAPPFIEAGASAVVLPVEEYYLGGQTGVVDGLIWAGSTEGYANGWYEVYPYFLTNALTGAAQMVVLVNLEMWNSLPSDIQKIVEMGCDTGARRKLTYYYNGEATTRKYFNLTTMPDEDWAKMEAGVDRVWEELAQESPRAAKAIQIIRDYNAEVEAAQWFR